MAVFLEPEYLKTAIELLIAINFSLNHEELSHPAFEPSLDKVVEIALLLSQDRYDPRDFFTGPPKKTLLSMIRKEKPFAINESMPDIDTDTLYTLLCLNACDKKGHSMGVQTAGIVYEDLFYAVLACFNIGKLKSNHVVPLQQGNYRNVWAQRTKIIDSLKGRRYNPVDYFAACDVAPDNLLRVIEVGGSFLKDMRGLGTTTDTVEKDQGIARYLLYSLF